jgi:hypothetical protein
LLPFTSQPIIAPMTADMVSLSPILAIVAPPR